jgi:hypothetical protein
MSVSFVDALNGWSTGYLDGATLRTTDGGDTWQRFYAPTDLNFSSVCFVNQDVGWVAGSDAAIFKSTSGGTTWFELYSDPDTPYSTLNSIYFLDPDLGWVVGSVELYGQSMSTADGGGDWIDMHGGHDNYLQSVHFVDELNGWAVGHDGTILRSIQEPTSVSEDFTEEEAGQTHAVLRRNSPNPFNPTTTLRYDLPRREMVTLKIYNILGEEVRTLIDRIQTPGPKTAVWDGTNSKGEEVGSGIYIYSLRVGDEIKSMKMALLR